MNACTLLDLVQNPRGHGDFVVLMCEDEEHLVRGSHER